MQKSPGCRVLQKVLQNISFYFAFKESATSHTFSWKSINFIALLETTADRNNHQVYRLIDAIIRSFFLSGSKWLLGHYGFVRMRSISTKNLTNTTFIKSDLPMVWVDWNSTHSPDCHVYEIIWKTTLVLVLHAEFCKEGLT